MTYDAAPGSSERPTVLVGYGLYLLAICSGGITALIGAIIAYVRRDDARGTVWESHYRNLITVFWVGLAFSFIFLAMAFSGVLAAVGLALSDAWTDGDWLAAVPLLGVAVPLVMLAWAAFALWYLFRVIRGFLRALDDKAY